MNKEHVCLDKYARVVSKKRVSFKTHALGVCGTPHLIYNTLNFLPGRRKNPNFEIIIALLAFATGYHPHNWVVNLGPAVTNNDAQWGFIRPPGRA